ncbi:MAG: AEC family transporter [Mariniphaga sp.]|nr:AEC family transporter [Mariniphaga sp.]
MDTFIVAFETVLPLFLVILTGTFFARLKMASQSWIEILNKYALLIGFPALVIVSMLHLEGELKTYFPLILINSAYIVALLLLVYPVAVLFGYSGRMKRSLFLILPFRNIAYLGIPILSSAFGDEILPVAALLSAVYIFWMLTLGLILIEAHGHEKFSLKKVGLNLIENPLLISVFIGIAIVSFGITLPLFADKTLRLFSGSVTAVVLFSLGIFLGLQDFGKPREWIQVAVFTAVTMLVLPAIFYGLLQFSNLPTNQFKSTVLDAAMPLGLTPYALSVQYHLETKLFARIVVLGTLLSIFIIPLWITIIG